VETENAAPIATVAARTVFQDDFSHGTFPGNGDSVWALRQVGELVRGDGIVTTGPDGLVVVPTGTNPDTGEPAFAIAPQPLGETEHLRWTAFADHRSAAGFPGFDVGDGLGLEAKARLSAQGFGLDHHPYGSTVTDPHRDLRLGAAVLICVDLESGLVLDFIVTDRCVFAVYERLAFPGSSHAGFSYAVPVLDRRPEDFHELGIAYDPSSATARWRVDGAEVLSVDRLGCRVLDPRHLKRDNGRPEQSAAPRQFHCGMGTFADQLWGQGIRLAVRGFGVVSGPAVGS
jgi:hypothetical protein